MTSGLTCNINGIAPQQRARYGWLVEALRRAIEEVMLVALYLMFGRRPCRRGDDYPYCKESESAPEILKKRYAKGGITREEFDRMKNDIADG